MPPAYQYVYVMKDLSKSYSGGKKVLENVYLSFYPGAKIGVLGPNGSGKSTLMKIMAGMDNDYSGEAWAAEGAKVGYLPQEPQLDTYQKRAGKHHGRAGRNARHREALRRGQHEAGRGRRRRRDERADRGTGRAAGKDRARRRVGPGAHGRDRDGRAALPAGRCRRDQAVGR